MISQMHTQMAVGDGVPGWVHWPGREDWSAEFMRLLASAQDGGATVAECYLAARRIRLDDDASWYREWKRLADVNMERGDAAIAGGNRATARSNWLRAVNYYLAAVFALEATDRRRRTSIAVMRQCARRLLENSGGKAELVAIPWLSGYPLEAYLLMPPDAEGPVPAVICLGEPGHHKEEFLFKLAHHASARGLALLALDVLGETSDDRLLELAGPANLEAMIGRAFEYLSTRPDVDVRRIAVLADGWGSSFVARGVAHDPRIAAAVCDAGIWDLHERAFLAGRAVGKNANEIPDVLAGRITRNIKCPLLVTIGERGWLKADRVRRIVEQLREKGRDIDLNIFTAAQTAASQGHADNPTLANEFVFDWLASRLGLLPD